MLIDTHTHIAFPEFDADRELVIERALEADVGKMILVGTDIESSQSAIKLAEQYPFLWATVGLHPHDAKDLDDPLLQGLSELADHPKVVAWGEVGLDLYYAHSTEKEQRHAFIEQIRLAKKKQLPLVIHTRDAWEETFELLINEHVQSHAETYGAVFHCFTGDRAIAERGIDLGFMISFSGIMTFKKAEALQEAAATIDLNKIVIETDAPYLAPQGKRGSRNEPAYVRFIAEKLAELRNVSYETIAETTSKNAERLFRIS